jgi:hypothetical protein
VARPPIVEQRLVNVRELGAVRFHDRDLGFGVDRSGRTSIDRRGARNLALEEIRDASVSAGSKRTIKPATRAACRRKACPSFPPMLSAARTVRAILRTRHRRRKAAVFRRRLLRVGAVQVQRSVLSERRVHPKDMQVRHLRAEGFDLGGARAVGCHDTRDARRRALRPDPRHDGTGKRLPVPGNEPIRRNRRGNLIEGRVRAMAAGADFLIGTFVYGSVAADAAEPGSAMAAPAVAVKNKRFHICSFLIGASSDFL